MKPFFRKLLTILVIIFALIGLVFTLVFLGMRFGIFNVRGSIADRNLFFGKSAPASSVETPACTDAKPTCDWNGTPEWPAIKGGLQKDSAVINRVSTETGVSSRMIAAVVVPEQTRFFTANREIFKSYFEPLKLLGSLTQFSLGVSGIKEDTAKDIEKYALAGPTTPFYPGDFDAQLFAYPAGADHDAELYKRLTDPKNHYYQYLYTALYIKEVNAQWTGQGYDVSRQPEVLVTLFNLGFQASHPNATPHVAGAPITTGGQTYAYGELGSLFYHSGELTDIFPQ